MYSVNYTHQFKKDMRKCAKRRLSMDAITQAINILAATGTLQTGTHSDIFGW